MTPTNPVYVCNAFSLQMLDLSTINNVKTFPANVVLKGDYADVTLDTDNGDVPVSATITLPIVSAIGHADTAKVLGLPMNRVNIHLNSGDSILVAQLIGGRLPEGSTTLPEGFSFKWTLLTVK
jgi:hypothetical protein